MSQKRSRRQFTGEQKAAIVKRHLVAQVPVSDLCDEYKILPTQFYQWQRQLFENGAAAFDRKKSKAGTAEQRKIEALQAKLLNKSEVISELMEENIKAKIANGELQTDAGFPTTFATLLSITFVTGVIELASPRSDSSPGWASRRASSTTGSLATVRSTNTTAGFLETTGSRTGSGRRSAAITMTITAKAIGV